MAVSLATTCFLDWRHGASGAEDSLPALSQPVSHFDPEVASALSPHARARIVRIHQGRVIYDNAFTTNNQGFVSARPLSRERQAARRYAVFGNSFTAAEYLPVPWVDRAQQLLTQRGLGDRLELVSCAKDGSNAANVGLSLQRLLNAGLELDGIVLAGVESGAYPFVWHFSPAGGHVGRVPWPLSEEDFHTDWLPRLAVTWLLRSDAELDAAIAGAGSLRVRPGACPLTRDAWRRARARSLAWVDRLPPPRPQPQEANSFEPVLELARARGLEVIVARVPDRDWARGVDELQGLEVEALALGLPLFDPVEAYRELDAYTNSALWFHGDGHWNQRGSDRYAELFADFISDHTAAAALR